jgi:YegS/Rv2252/BmrU family lipid kinase
MKYIFILNPRAGRKKNARNHVDLIDDYMRNSNHDYEFAFTTCAGDATHIAQKSASDGFDIIVAMGGDGTVNEVASGLIHSKGALGIIPSGSGNGIARSLDIPLELEKNIPFLIDPQIITMDVGKVNGKFFIGISGTGFDAVIGQKFQEFGVRGPIPYFMIGVKEYMQYHPQKYLIEVEQEKFSCEALLIAVANTKQYGNGAIIAPQADPTDGLLDVCIIQNLNPVGSIKLVPMLFKGNIDQCKSITFKKCKTMKISSEAGGMLFHRDGEPDSITESLDIAIVEKSLKVCSPL